MEKSILEVFLILQVCLFLGILYDVFAKKISKTKDYLESLSVPAKYIGTIVAASILILSITEGVVWRIFNQIVPDEAIIRIKVKDASNDNAPVDKATVIFLCENQSEVILNDKGDGVYEGKIKYAKKTDLAFVLIQKEMGISSFTNFPLNENFQDTIVAIYVDGFVSGMKIFQKIDYGKLISTDSFNFNNIDTLILNKDSTKSSLILKEIEGERIEITID